MRGHGHIVMGLIVAWLAGACANGVPQERGRYWESLRLKARSGDVHSARALASEIAQHGRRVGGLVRADGTLDRLARVVLEAVGRGLHRARGRPRESARLSPA